MENLSMRLMGKMSSEKLTNQILDSNILKAPGSISCQGNYCRTAKILKNVDRQAIFSLSGSPYSSTIRISSFSRASRTGL